MTANEAQLVQSRTHSSACGMGYPRKTQTLTTMRPTTYAVANRTYKTTARLVYTSVLIVVVVIALCVQFILYQNYHHLFHAEQQQGLHLSTSSQAAPKNSKSSSLTISTRGTSNTSVTSADAENSPSSKDRNDLNDLNDLNGQNGQNGQNVNSKPQNKYNNKTNPEYYIIFSTSCTDQQNWESWVFFYHAHRVQQRGIITRIVSGCPNADYESKLLEFHKKFVLPYFGSRFRLHFTPDFSRPLTIQHASTYKYFNKPFGVLDWFENGPFQLRNKTKEEKRKSTKMSSGDDDNKSDSDIWDSIVFLLDPDMILLRPLRHDFTNEDVIYAAFTETNDMPQQHIRTRIVKHGYPMAQQDGYLNNEWMTLNWTHVFAEVRESQESQPQRSPPPTFVPPPPKWEGPIYWNTGPPYIATAWDMYNIVRMWSTIVVPIHNHHPHLFAEMYGYIIATVQLGLRHTMIKSIVISTTTSINREGWQYIDALPDSEICDVANAVVTQPFQDVSHQQQSSVRLPIGLHYCKRYILFQNFISKYRIKKNIMNCDKALLKSITNLSGIFPVDGSLASDNGYNSDNVYYPITPPRADRKDASSWLPVPGEPRFGHKVAKREAFMLCSLTAAFNAAFRYYKINTTACIDSSNSNNGKATKKHRYPPNLNETYTVYSDPSDY